VLGDIPQGEYIAVYQNWMKRLRWVIKNGGSGFAGSPRTEEDTTRIDMIKTSIGQTSAEFILTFRTFGLTCISGGEEGRKRIDQKVMNKLSNDADARFENKSHLRRPKSDP
jgi:hypothetical protein